MTMLKNTIFDRLEVGMAEFAVECQECRCIGPITGDIMLAISDWNEAPQPVQVES